MRKLNLFLTLVALSLASTNLWAKPAAADENGKLPGVFRVGCDVYVYFSQGNLQYIGSASTPYWKFAEEQCIFLGDNQTGSSSTIDRDLFGYGQSQTPWKTSTNNGDYSWQGDWGRNVISNGGNSGKPTMWRTLTKDEWLYIINTRKGDDASVVASTSNARYAKATINTDINGGVTGLILFPASGTFASGEFTNVGSINQTSGALTSTTCTSAQWLALEAKGCVFLPLEGRRYGTSRDDKTQGYYWSSTGIDSDYAYGFLFAGSRCETYNVNKKMALGVRLVQDMPDELKPEVPKAYVTYDPVGKTNMTYTGSSQTLLSSLASGATGGTVKYKLSTSGSWNTSNPTATNAGDYIVQWFVDHTGNTQCYQSSDVQEIHVTIKRASTSAPSPMPTIDAATLTYNGSAQNLVTSTGDIQSGYTTVYSTDGVNWSSTIPQGTNAGDYTVYYKFYKGDNYEYVPSPNTLDASIAKADLPGVTLPEATSTIPYDGTEKTLLEIDPVANATIWYKLGSGEWTTTPPTATDADVYSVQYKIVPNDQDNYNTIGPNTVTVTIFDYPFVADNDDPTAKLAEFAAAGSMDLKVKRTIYADGEYNTICLPFAVSASDLANDQYPLYGYERLKAFKGASVSGSGQDLSIDIFVEDVDHMDAGVPYLITYPAGNADIVNPVFTDITVTETTPGNVSADGVTFQGMFAQVHIDQHNGTKDYLFLGENSQLYWPLTSENGNESVKMRGFRAYFIIDRNAIPAHVAPRGTHARFVNAPQIITSIIELDANQCTKFIENGSLIILKNGIRYNAQGQVVK